MKSKAFWRCSNHYMGCTAQIGTTTAVADRLGPIAGLIAVNASSHPPR